MRAKQRFDYSTEYFFLFHTFFTLFMMHYLIFFFLQGFPSKSCNPNYKWQGSLCYNSQPELDSQKCGTFTTHWLIPDQSSMLEIVTKWIFSWTGNSWTQQEENSLFAILEVRWPLLGAIDKIQGVPVNYCEKSWICF